MVLGGTGDDPLQWAAIALSAAKIGWPMQTLATWVKHARSDVGKT